MSDKGELGERMKGLERREAGRRTMAGLPVCARVDGRRFSRWTAGLARPFDERLSKLMVQVTRELVDATQARVGYTQSDEISLIYCSEGPGKRVYLDGRIQKLTSILASLATAKFNVLLGRCIPERADDPALFDCRVWDVPSLEEAANVLLWREQDATKNSLSMAARSYYPHEELEGKDGAALHQLLFDRGVNWNDYPAFFKRGTYVQRRTVSRPFTAIELAELPEKHRARSNPALVVERSEVQVLDLPPMPGGEKAIGATVAWAQSQVGWPAEDLAWMSAAASNRHVRLTLVRPVESPVVRDPAYEARAAKAMRDEAYAALTRALACTNGDPSERQALLGGAANRPVWEVRDLARQIEAGLTPREAGRATDQAAALAKRMQSERLQDPMIRWLNSPRPDPLKGGAASDPMTDQIFFEQARRQLSAS